MPRCDIFRKGNFNDSLRLVIFMPPKRKASKARMGNLQVAVDALSDKRRKSTPADSDREEDAEKPSGNVTAYDLIVCY